MSCEAFVCLNAFCRQTSRLIQESSNYITTLNHLSTINTTSVHTFPINQTSKCNAGATLQNYLESWQLPKFKGINTGAWSQMSYITILLVILSSSSLRAANIQNIYHSVTIAWKRVWGLLSQVKEPHGCLKNRVTNSNFITGTFSWSSADNFNFYNTCI